MTKGDSMQTGRRGRLAGLGVGGGLLAILVAVALAAPAALLLADRTCGCAQPPDLVVTNRDDQPVTVSWRQAGLLGAFEGHSGTTRIEACDGDWEALPQGTIHVEIRSAAGSRAFDLEIPQRFASDPIGAYVVHAGGAVEDVTHAIPADEPAGSTCGIMGS
jgi:hypothetical protein